MLRRLTSTQLVVDLVIAGGWLVVNAVPLPGLDLGRVLVSLGMAATLALRRLAPLLALAVAWATCLAQVAAGVGPLPANLAILPMLFACAVYGTTAVRWSAFGSAFAGAAVITFSFVFPRAVGQMISGRWPDSSLAGGSTISAFLMVAVLYGFTCTVFLLSWTAGILYRTWRQSRRNRSVAAEAVREVVAEQERNRIARDMHDVVAHSLAVVVAQADGARYLRQQDPEAVDGALQTIASTAREALADVRVLLAQLRHSQAEGPQPSLGDLGRLLDQLRTAGLTVRREDAGPPMPLGTAQQLAVYRIVQESLTNALRHADTTREVVVHVGWMPHGLDLVVASALPAERERPDRGSPGLGAPGLGALGLGHGIAGMTERALLVGGRLTARPEGGQFVVRAWLPLHPVTPGGVAGRTA